jgi:hypothetical protein
MEPDAQAGRTRPRPWLLIALGIGVTALVATWLWPTESATRAVSASNQAGKGRGQRETVVDPKELDVRLGKLEAAETVPGDVERNPFRFKPKPPAPPPPGEFTTAPGPKQIPTPDPASPTTPQVPPIPLKFIGTLETDGLKLAAVSDCKGFTDARAEGQIIDGRYRLIRIGVESIVIEYVNGTGRTTLRMDGCPPR